MTDTSTRPEVISRAAEVIAVPKAAPANSFVLHAPLELMARVQLLPFVHPDQRGAALAMIEWLADQYEAAGDSVDEPTPVAGPPRPAELLAAIAAGDQSRVDALATAWLPQWSPGETAGLVGESIVTSLAAAGHAPIGLALLLRDPASSRLLRTTLLRGALRSLAAQPDWHVTWHHDIDGEGDASRLYDALRAAPQLGRPGSDFIYPLMTQAQQPGVADRLLGPVLSDRFHVPDALHTITRVAAWSMLYDDPTQAPYGWSHALTMPQGVMVLAGVGVRARTALAVAGTFALGFRVGHGTTELPERIVAPSGPAATPADLATAASLHEDAHLVKYVLACLHAAADDPAYRILYLAAAARLVDWWQPPS